MDSISSLVGRQGFAARVFFNGEFCEANDFTEDGMNGHLHLVRRGPVVFRHGAGGHACVLRIDEPAMVYYPRGLSHQLEVPDRAQASLLCASIAFEDGARNLLARVLPDCLVLPLREVDEIAQSLGLLFTEAAAPLPGRDLVLDRLCDVLAIQVIRHHFASGAPCTGLLAGLADRQLAPALAAIHERPQHPWQVADLARLACMSRTRFALHFRDVVGMPPGEYLAARRLSLAKDLLRQGRPVKAVSAETGYRSAPAFTRAFTEQAGLSPRAWLQQWRAAA